VRLFVAADLPEDLRRRLAAIQAELRDITLPVRWVRPEGIHLTFKFLGQVQGERVAEIGRALEGAGRGVAPFRVHASGIGTFPERGNPRVLWVGVGGDLEAAAQLRDAIERALGTIGFPPEGRDFRPHLTLGRVRGQAKGEWRPALERAARQAEGAFEVQDYVLFESRHDRSGAVYLPMRRYRLAAPGGGA
jgi:2'-5' RNA ligase